MYIPFTWKKMYIVFFLTLLSSSLPFSAHPRPSNTSDQLALFAFRAAIYDEFGSLDTWNRDIPFCQWTGIMCSLRGERVVGLNLTNMELRGFISPLIANLSFLQSLDLSHNFLQGPIPPQLGRLSDLTLLDLRSNNLQGSIPCSLENLSALTQLYLSSNNLQGSIPPCLGNLSALTELHLSYNNLQGSIPSSLGNLSALTKLYLSSNNLQGSIPPSLGNLSVLTQLHLSYNNLQGSIPSSLGNLSALTQLYLRYNNLQGSIPSSLGNLSALTQLYLSNNNLQGSIPSSLGNPSALTQLHLGYNNLQGSIPSYLGNLSALTQLYLWSNNLQGSIPSSLGNPSTLTQLYLSTNNLQGSIPSSLGNLSALTELHLGYNNLQGSIPSSLGNPSALTQLYLSSNNLQGSIPSSLGNLSALTKLYLGYNNLHGSIPSSLGNLSALTKLYLGDNNLQGSIPPSLGNLSALTQLFLGGNNLQGSIPSSLGNLSALTKLYLGGNNIQGSIPSSLGNLSALTQLLLGGNNLEGSIPSSLGKLSVLTQLDLSSNNLSGSIPNSLEKLKLLVYANFSYNNLTGVIPREGIFSSLSPDYFEGNPGLRRRTHLSPSPTSREDLLNQSHSHLKRVIGPIAGIGGFILCCSLVVFFWNHKSRGKSSKFSEFFELKVGYPRISYETLVNATNGFNEANLLGVGSFGSVYEGILGDGTVVAIKVLNLQNEEAHSSFNRECKILGRVRHRNLVKIITSYSSPDFKCLILQYMSHGSLEDHLYPGEGQHNNVFHLYPGLNLNKRLKIAIDLAHGMAYLHHHCFVEVVHCDLKPSNVLLDETLTAHVTDFGIARLFSPNSTDSLTTTLALKGTLGYIAPEYGLGGRISTSGDVYSYGILLLEMLTRKKPTDGMFVGGLNLQQWVSMTFPTRIMDVVDNSLLRDLDNDAVDQQQMLGCLTQLIRVGLWCTKQSPKERPTMLDIVGILDHVRQTYFGIRGPPTSPLDISSLLNTASVVANHAEASESHSSTL